MEKYRIKKILEATRKSEFISTLILTLAIAMFIGFCAHSANMQKELESLQQQIMSIQSDVNKIEYEVVK